MNTLSPERARRVFRRAKKAIQIGFIADNFVDVWGSIVAGRKLGELRLRNGVRLGAPDSVELWNHFNDIWLDHVYDGEGYDIPQNGNVVDIGANIGLFSLLAARRAARVLAFEPFGPCFEWLSRNVASNGQSNVVQPFKSAVASNAGSRTFHVQPQLTSNSFYSTEGQAVTVECTTLEAIVQNQCGGRCDFLKMDCEGAEFEILLGCSDDTLRRIGVIAMEVHEGVGGHTAADLERRLRQAGFSVRVAHINGPLIMKARNDDRNLGRPS